MRKPARLPIDLMADTATDDQKATAARAQTEALAAFRAGQSALAEGQFDTARQWLERARRLAPSDLAIGLMLGVTQVRIGASDAAMVLLREVADRGAGREAWIALAGAAHDAGQMAEAEAALQRGLSGFRLPDDLGFGGLAGRIAIAAGRPGWCGVRADRGMEIHATGKIVVTQDGVRLTHRAGDCRRASGNYLKRRAFARQSRRSRRISTYRGFGHRASGWVGGLGVAEGGPGVHAGLDHQRR